MVRRRHFLLAAGALAAAPLASAQQPAGNTRRIGWLEPGTPSSFPTRREAFLATLRKLGQVEGENLAIDYRYAHGRLEQLPAMATELAGLRPDCFVATGIDVVRALKAAAPAIPLVIGTIDADPVAEGLAASMARPGGNITGVVGISWELAGKRLELLKEAVPKTKTVAIVFDERSRAGQAHTRVADAAARRLRITLRQYRVKDAQDLHEAVRGASRARADALSVVAVGIVNSHRQRLAALAQDARLPSIASNNEFVEDGGLLGYAANLDEQFRRAAAYVDKILRGAKAGDLALEQPTKFELTVNVRTAKAIGVKISQALLARADRVIE